MLLSDYQLATDELALTESEKDDMCQETIQASLNLQKLEENCSNLKDEVRMIRKERDELKSLKDLNLPDVLQASSSASCSTCVQFLKNKADLIT
jgi:hypothetical protein